MSTRDTIRTYFDRLEQRSGWEASFADDIVFTSRTSPVREMRGKAAFIPATSRFYSMIRAFTLRELIVDGDRACALTRYELQPPTGAPIFSSEVAELFQVTGGKISTFAIYFDTTPYPK